MEIDRINHPLMEYYRFVYKNSVLWDGKQDLNNKTVIVYCEQGYGDIIQFLRYIPYLKNLNCKIILHCPVELHRLIKNHCLGIDELLDKFNPELPIHDYHILLMELPFLLQLKEIPRDPYIFNLGTKDISDNNATKIGIVWEGRTNSCPLYNFKLLKGELYCLQKDIQLNSLANGCESLDLFGVLIEDFLDTAKLINSLDAVVSVDTSVLHLAGAIGKRTYALLDKDYDSRWDIPWYTNFKLMKFKDNWSDVFKAIDADLATLALIT